MEASSRSWPMRSTWARCRSARRNVSIARRLATVISHAPGLLGMPSSGQDSRAATSASWARSSASWRSRVIRTSPETTRADSSCQTVTTASWVVVTTHSWGGWAVLGLADAPYLRRALPAGPMVQVDLHHPARALDCLLVGADIEHGVPALDLLRLRKRPVHTRQCARADRELRRVGHRHQPA